MKKTKKLTILLGALAVTCAATGIVMGLEQKKEEIRSTEETVLTLDSDSVTALSWNYEDTSLAFHKDETWQYDEDAAFPVSEEKINELLSLFTDMKAAFAIDNAEDLSQYGLDDPTCTITVTAGDETTEITLGAFSTMDSQRYLTLGDGKVYLVETDPYDSFAITLSDMIANDTTPQLDVTNTLTVEGEDTYTIEYKEASTSVCADDRYFTEKDGAEVPLDTMTVDDYLSTVTNLTLENYVTYNVTDEDLAAWGLDEPELTVTADYIPVSEDGDADSETFTFHIGRNKEEAAAEADALMKDEEYDGTVTSYIRIGDSPIVYELEESDYEALTACSYNDLRHTNLLTADFGDVTEIDVTLEGQDYVLTPAPEDDDDEKTYQLGEDTVDITGFRSNMADLLVETFTDEAPTDQKEEIRLVFKLNNEDHPQVEIVLYRQDGTHCMVVVDGEPVGLVTRDSAVDLIESVNALVLG